MKNRPRIQRGLLRRALRKHMRESDSQTGNQLQLALDDETVFETLYEAALAEAKLFGHATGAFQFSLASDGQSVVDNLLKLLQWFVDNGPLLIEIIQQIIGMFGNASIAKELFEDETLFVE